ncbi:hypothetical protein EXIGLDRAFT_600499 [Exidia glandulosa HHB12029]|uniref:Co-chaperone HscB C-terminal oligomerisation domain-containing protein n=1 Tax=Exidia glandulosa HHB12029 TaxID=1314781 RepID=A0A165QHZ9_EXIGL|nr:hypothetical protein EXIGLDRAFT_600499 [Exidia glandulosa HHB12029]
MLSWLRTPLASIARATPRRFLSASARTCPKCGAPLPTALPACPACRFIAPVAPDTSWHQLLDQPDARNPFAVDRKALRAAFLRAQQVCHPDVWAGQPRDSQDLASAHSALLNTAFKALSDPRQRAEYILAQNGRGAEERDSLDDPEFVMSVMDSREQLEECESEEERAEIAEANRDEMHATVARIKELIGQRDWDAAKTETIKLKYLEGIDAAARGVEHH